MLCVYSIYCSSNTSEEARIDQSCTEVKLLKKIYFVMTFYLILSKHLSAGTKCIAQKGEFIFDMMLIFAPQKSFKASFLMITQSKWKVA